MKVRLIMETRKHPGHIPVIDTVNPIHPVVWPDDEAIPDGWEELEFEASFHGTHLVGLESTDPCQGCSHRRSHHVAYKHKCLKLTCDCKGFEEVE